MKSFIFVFAVAVALFASVQSEEEEHAKPKEFKQWIEDCAKEVDLDMEIVNKAEKGEFEKDTDLKCFPKCLFLKAGFMHPDGTMDVEGTVEKAKGKKDADKRVPIVEECTKLTGEDACETADKVFRCYWEKVIAAGINH